MTRNYILTPVVQAAIAKALDERMHWVAYNTTFLMLDKEDLFFSDNAMEAAAYAEFKTNEIDLYSFGQFDSIKDFLYKISQTKEPTFLFNKKQTV